MTVAGDLESYVVNMIFPLGGVCAQVVAPREDDGFEFSRCKIIAKAWHNDPYHTHYDPRV